MPNSVLESDPKRENQSETSSDIQPGKKLSSTKNGQERGGEVLCGKTPSSGFIFLSTRELFQLQILSKPANAIHVNLFQVASPHKMLLIATGFIQALGMWGCVRSKGIQFSRLSWILEKPSETRFRLHDDRCRGVTHYPTKWAFASVSSSISMAC